jgi:GNAT superfamily N-acetyltransferase
MDLPIIHRFLAEESYWAKGIGLEALGKGLANSLCFAGFMGREQVAFGRAITDFSSFGYVKDVFVLPEARGRGYGKELIAAMLERLDAEGVATLMLATQDAHTLYRGFGFELVDGSTKYMRRIRPQPDALP